MTRHLDHPRTRRLGAVLAAAALAAGMGSQAAGASAPPPTVTKATIAELTVEAQQIHAGDGVTRHALENQMAAAQATMPEGGVRAAVAGYYRDVAAIKGP